MSISQRSSTPFQPATKAGSRGANTAIESHSKAAASVTLEAETNWVLDNLTVIDATTLLTASFGKLATDATKVSSKILSDCFRNEKGSKEWKLEADMYDPLCLAFNKCCEGIKPDHDLGTYVPKHPLKCVDIHNKRYSLAPEMTFHTKIGPDLCLSFDSNTDGWLACDHPNILIEIKGSALTDISFGTAAEPSQARKESMRQLFGYVAYGQWPALPYRFCWSISISGHLMRIWRWTASGVVVTEPIKYLEDATVVAQFIRLVASGPYSRLGLDVGRGMAFSSIASSEETVRTRRAISVYTDSLPHNKARARWFEKAQECDVWRFQLSDLPDASDYILVVSHPISWTLGIFSRGTRCYIAIYQSNAKKEEDIEIASIHTLKLSWQYTTRTSELVFFEKVRKQPPDQGATYLASVLCGGDVPYTRQKMGLFQEKNTGNSSKVTRSTARAINDEDLIEGYQPVNLNQLEVVGSDPRIYRWILFKEVGAPLSDFTNSKQLVQAIYDAVEAHKYLHSMGVLHRDISEGNVLLNISNDYRGLLIDLDMAMDLEASISEEQAEVFRPAITGTPRFLSVAMASRPIHRSWHDLESFFWLLVYMTLKHVPEVKLISKLGVANPDSGRAATLRAVFPDDGTDTEAFDAMINAKVSFLEKGQLEILPLNGALINLFDDFQDTFDLLHRALQHAVLFQEEWARAVALVALPDFGSFKTNPHSFETLEDVHSFQKDCDSALAALEEAVRSDDDGHMFEYINWKKIQSKGLKAINSINQLRHFPSYEYFLSNLKKALERPSSKWMAQSPAIEYEPYQKKRSQSKGSRNNSQRNISTRSMTASSSGSIPMERISEALDISSPTAPVKSGNTSESTTKERKIKGASTPAVPSTTRESMTSTTDTSNLGHSMTSRTRRGTTSTSGSLN